MQAIFFVKVFAFYLGLVEMLVDKNLKFMISQQLVATVKKTSLIWSPMGHNFLTLLVSYSRWLLRSKVTLYINDGYVEGDLITQSPITVLSCLLMIYYNIL